ncbi:T9SS type A sorting domain-containing protein [Candidatus Poribacteria bacterium]
MLRRIFVILVSLVLLCSFGSRAARALPAQPLTLHGNLTVDGTQLKQSDPYFTRYVAFMTIEGQAEITFSYTMGDNPSDEYWLIAPMSMGDREQGTVQIGDAAHIFIDTDSNPSSGNEVEITESPYTIGSPGEDVTLNISCSMEPGKPTDFAVNLSSDSNGAPDFGKVALVWTASGNDGNLRTVDGYEGIISNDNPSGQALEDWWDDGDSFGTSGWRSLLGPSEEESRVANLDQPVDYASTYQGTKYYVGLRAVKPPGPMVYAKINMPPEAFDLSINPANPKTGDDLVGEYSYRDPEDEPEDVNGTQIRWYRNGAVQPAYNNKLTVPSTAITGGGTWYFTVQPDDGNSPGIIAASASVSVMDADLEVSMSVNNDSPNEGDTITYTITVTNNGPDDATNVEITDLLPSGITYLSDNANDNYDSNTGVWTVGDLGSGTDSTLTIKAAVAPGFCADTITNTAGITAVDQGDPDSRNSSDSVDITVQCADLEVSVVVDDPAPNEGDTISYAITVTNNGPDTATNVEITDLLPSGIAYVSDDANGNYDSNTGVWTLGVLNGGASAILTIMATVGTGIVNENTCGVPIVNIASISAVDQADPDSSNNSDGAGITLPCADLAVIMSVDNDAPNEGDTVTFAVTVTNNGPDTATNVEIIDAMPSGLEYASAKASQRRLVYVSPAFAQGGRGSGEILWTVGDLSSGASATLAITAIVDTDACADSITNTAYIATVDQSDPDIGNNSGSADITLPCADLAVSMSVNNHSPSEGDTVTYTITVMNNGPDRATNVVITDQLPSGLTYVSSSPNQGSYNSDVGEWSVGVLDSGASATLAITATLNHEGLADTVIIYTTSVIGADQADPDIDNNSSSVSLTVSFVKADLAVKNEVDNDSPNVGDTVTYTVTVTNNGPGAVTNAVVTDLMPSGLAYTSATATQGSYNSNTGAWSIGDLANGASAILTIAATVDTNTCADTITNIVIVTAMDQADPFVSNNNDSADITVQCADLAVDMSVDNDSPNVGDTIIYTIIVTNNGPDRATNFEITDLMPPGLAYASDNVNGNYDSNTGVWTVDNLNSGVSAILIITAIVDTNTCADSITNTASITAVDQSDPDSSNNNDSTEITAQCADLEISNMVDNTLPSEGDTIAYTITVINNGPDDATNVVVTDQLPSGIIYVSDDSNGSYDSNTGEWTVGDLNSGTSAVLTITAIVDAGMCAGTITNFASVTAVDQADSNSGNNSDSANISVRCADLEIDNSVDNNSPNEGDIVTYTITVTNNGPDAATNIEITHLLPQEVTYVSDSPSQGNYNSSEGGWAVGSLSDDASATLIITAIVDAGTGGTTIRNSASVTGMDQADPDITNNVFSASLTAVKLKLISASYEVMESHLTLIFSDLVDLEQPRLDRIGIEVANNIIPGFNLLDGQNGCPSITTGAPYEDDGAMLYPVTIDIQCDLLSVLGLAIPAFVTALSDDIDLVLESGAFTDPYGGQSQAADVPLNITANGFDLRTKGDVGGDGEITAYDAGLILQYIVYGESALPIYDTVAELEGWLEASWRNEEDVDILGYLANTDGLPGITANDAAMVLRFSTGLTDSLCESCAPIANITSRNGRLLASGYNDRELRVSIHLDDVSDMYSADMVVTYDPQALTLTDVSKAAAISSWLSEHRTTAPGELRISLAGASQPTANGSLVTLSFDMASPDAIRKLDLIELKVNGGSLNTAIQNLPKSFVLLQNYPNPFNPETWIPYHLSEPANVTVTIYSMTGQIVRRLELGNMMPGAYTERSKAAYWDGKNEADEKVSSGIYYYQLRAGQDTSVRKMIIAR